MLLALLGHISKARNYLGLEQPPYVFCFCRGKGHRKNLFQLWRRFFISPQMVRGWFPFVSTHFSHGFCYFVFVFLANGGLYFGNAFCTHHCPNHSHHSPHPHPHPPHPPHPPHHPRHQHSRSLHALFIIRTSCLLPQTFCGSHATSHCSMCSWFCWPCAPGAPWQHGDGPEQANAFFGIFWHSCQFLVWFSSASCPMNSSRFFDLILDLRDPEVATRFQPHRQSQCSWALSLSLSRAICFPAKTLPGIHSFVLLCLLSSLPKSSVNKCYTLTMPNICININILYFQSRES